MKNKVILETIKETYGKVVYTHKVHEKESEIKAKAEKIILGKENSFLGDSCGKR